MKYLIFAPLFSIALFTGCNEEAREVPRAPASAEKKAEGFVPVDVDAKGAAAMMKNKPDLVVLDVRTPGEFSEGHIAGAKNIDFKGADFEKKLGKLDRSTPYLVHCRSGSRSGQSMAAFEKLGFTNIIHLNTGFLDWQESGQPVEK